MEEDPK
jgi:hypothetical protein